MKIYIDFDDVLCETAKYFTVLVKELFAINVPYEQVHSFNLQKSFNLNDVQYDELMKAGHLPQNLLAYEETFDASKTVNKWKREGHDVYIITGRPFDSYEPSRKWLDTHKLEKIPLYCVDKYGREIINQNCSYNMTLTELYKMDFDFAVEDSPSAFQHVAKFNHCKVAVYNRPWNKNSELPDSRFKRCNNWKEIDKMFEEIKRV